MQASTHVTYYNPSGDTQRVWSIRQFYSFPTTAAGDNDACALKGVYRSICFFSRSSSLRRWRLVKFNVSLVLRIVRHQGADISLDAILSQQNVQLNQLQQQIAQYARAP